MKSDNSILLVAAWGAPFGWEKVEYVLPNYSEPFVCRSSTFPLLLHSYKDMKNVYGKVFLLDSSVSARSRDECVQRITKSDKLPEAFNSYNEMIDYVIQRTFEWVQKCGCPDYESFSERITFSVIPNVGKYSNWEYGYFMGKSIEPYSLAYPLMVLDLLRTIIDKKPDEIVVDLSHSPNYIVVSLKDAVIDVAKLYSITLQREVRVLFYNSNPLPFPFPKNEIPQIPIHKTDEILVTPREAAEDVALELNRKGELPNSILKLDPKIVGREEAKKYYQILEKAFNVNLNLLRKYSVASARIFTYSMALAGAYIVRDLLSFNYDYMKGVKYLAEILFNGIVNMSRINKSLNRIELPMKIKSNEIITLLKAFALSYYLVKRYKEELGNQILDNVVEEGLSLNEMEVMSPYLSSFYESVLKSEIDSYKKKCLNGDSGRSNCEIEIDRGKWPSEECNLGSLNPRNMKAHIGLEKNLVEGRVDNGNLRVRYRKLEGSHSRCWNEILDKLSKPEF